MLYDFSSYFFLKIALKLTAKKEIHVLVKVKRISSLASSIRLSKSMQILCKTVSGFSLVWQMENNLNNKCTLRNFFKPHDHYPKELHMIKKRDHDNRAKTLAVMFRVLLTSSSKFDDNKGSKGSGSKDAAVSGVMLLLLNSDQRDDMAMVRMAAATRPAFQTKLGAIISFIIVSMCRASKFLCQKKIYILNMKSNKPVAQNQV